MSDEKTKPSPLITALGDVTLDRMLDRYARFLHPHHHDCSACEENADLCPKLLMQEGQVGRVKVFLNSCVDSRFGFSTIFQPRSGEVIGKTGLGALLPEYGHPEFNNIWSTVIFAAQNLGIRTFVQFGHTDCGYIQAATDYYLEIKNTQEKRADTPLTRILDAGLPLIAEAESLFIQDHQRAPSTAELKTAAEYHNVRQGVTNLEAYLQQHLAEPYRVYGLVIDGKTGTLYALQPDKSFASITHLPTDEQTSLCHSCCQT